MNIKFYKCKHCGQIVAMVEATGVPIICCGDPMEEMVANTTDASIEKHVPECKVESGNIHVDVGEVAHPMSADHYIKWILVETDQGSYLKVLKPEDKPFACFTLGKNEKPCCTYDYCNIHGLWKR